MARTPKELIPGSDTLPIFALKKPKDISIPKQKVAISPATAETMDLYVTWASEAIGCSFDEAQTKFLDHAILDLISKDPVYKARNSSVSGAATKTKKAKKAEKPAPEES